MISSFMGKEAIFFYQKLKILHKLFIIISMTKTYHSVVLSPLYDSIQAYKYNFNLLTKKIETKLNNHKI